MPNYALPSYYATEPLSSSNWQLFRSPLPHSRVKSEQVNGLLQPSPVFLSTLFNCKEMCSCSRVLRHKWLPFHYRQRLSVLPPRSHSSPPIYTSANRSHPSSATTWFLSWLFYQVKSCAMQSNCQNFQLQYAGFLSGVKAWSIALFSFKKNARAFDFTVRSLNFCFNDYDYLILISKIL